MAEVSQSSSGGFCPVDLPIFRGARGVAVEFDVFMITSFRTKEEGGHLLNRLRLSKVVRGIVRAISQGDID